MSSLGLNPISVAEAGPIVAEALSMNWTNQRGPVLKVINKYRNLLYNLYDDVKLLNEVNHCICLSDFREACTRGCDSATYRGFTLPYDVMSVESAWESNHVITQRSRWRESIVGRGNHGASMEMFEVPGLFPTERDMNCVTRLKLYAESNEDNGLVAHVVVIDADWNEKTLAFSLQGDSWVTVDCHVMEIKSVSLPPVRDGGIWIAQEGGYELSRYATNETVPAYRRYKVAVPCAAEKIYLQCTRKWLPVHFDHDLVEVGDTLVIEAAARYFKYGENSTDSSDIKRAEYDLARMKELLVGLLNRGRGRSTQDGTPFRGRPLPRYRKTLPGY